VDANLLLQYGTLGAERIECVYPATVVKYALCAALSDQWGEVAAIRARLRRRELTREALRAAAGGMLPALLAAARRALPAWDERLAQPEISARMLDLALDAMESEALAPEVQLRPDALTLAGRPLHILVFSAFPQVANELYPLLVDAYVANQSFAGGPRYQVVGVHERWLRAGNFRRALLFDECRMGLQEADIAAHPPIRGAQVFAVNLREERASHRRIADALPGVPLTNPCAGVERLDDKAWTGRCWARAGVLTPRFIALTPTVSPEAVQQFLLRAGPLLVLKPCDGTEGQGVAYVQARKVPAQLDTWRRQGHLLLMAAHGLLRFAGTAGPLPCTVRLNVCWDGRDAQVESGYAQVAAMPEGIASVGRGGSMIPLTELWTHLARPNGAAVTPTPDDWLRVRRAAAAGVETLAAALGTDMPALVGIDVLLDLASDGSLQPLLLEANGRPAGMSHSCYLASTGPDNGPGVSQYLWQVVLDRMDHVGGVAR
jgi:hypothetical protein